MQEFWWGGAQNNKYTITSIVVPILKHRVAPVWFGYGFDVERFDGVPVSVQVVPLGNACFSASEYSSNRKVQCIARLLHTYL